MTDTAADRERAERAADFADRRARDVSRETRWAVAFVAGMVALVVTVLITLTVQVNGIAADLADLRDDLAPILSGSAAP